MRGKKLSFRYSKLLTLSSSSNHPSFLPLLLESWVCFSANSRSKFETTNLQQQKKRSMYKSLKSIFPAAPISRSCTSLCRKVRYQFAHSYFLNHNTPSSLILTNGRSLDRSIRIQLSLQCEYKFPPPAQSTQHGGGDSIT